MKIQTVHEKRIFEVTLNEDEAFDLGCASYEAESVRRGGGLRGGAFFYGLPEDMRADIRATMNGCGPRG